MKAGSPVVVCCRTGGVEGDEVEDWVKLSVRYYADAKVEALPDADAEVLFVRGLAKAGEVGRGGFIPAESLPKLGRRRRYAASVRALVAVGLWTKVDGGFQVAGWAHWQDSFDALARRRTTDRDRQRRRRAVALETGTSGSNPPGERAVSRDLGPLSRDTSRDVTVAEGELDADVGGGLEGEFRVREPSSRCSRHAGLTEAPPCGACADARQARQRWVAQQASRRRKAPRCLVHRGQPRDNCALCRSEQLGADP